jgi:hypothetical protein
MPKFPSPLAVAFAVSAAVHAALLAASGPFPPRRPELPAPDFILVRTGRPPEARPAGARPAAPPPAAPRAPSASAGRAAAGASGPAAAAAGAPVSSAELLNDPQKGAVFSRYFQSVKAKIQASAEFHGRFLLREYGKVDVDFVLDRGGAVVSLDARPKNPASQNPLILSRALDILHGAAPFPRFPDEIAAGSISFNITLVFDD